MPQQPQSPDPRREAARQGGTWTEEEKARGAGHAPHALGADTGAAGEAAPKGRPSDDREATEAAAAAIQAENQGEGDAALAGGGKGTRSMGGSATEPGTAPKR